MIASRAGIRLSPPSSEKRGVDEGLQRLGLRQLEQDAALVVAGQLRLVGVLLDRLAHPAAAFAVLDVLVLDADRTAVGLLQPGDDVAQLEAGGDAADVVRELAVEISFGDAVGVETEQRIGGAVVQSQRVEVADGVADVAVGVDQTIDALLVAASGLGRDLQQVGVLDAAAAAPAGAQHRLLVALGGGPGEAEVEALEEQLPVRADAGGVCLPGAVELFDESGVGLAGGIGRGGHVVLGLLCGRLCGRGPQRFDAPRAGRSCATVSGRTRWADESRQVHAQIIVRYPKRPQSG